MRCNEARQAAFDSLDCAIRQVHGVRTGMRVPRTCVRYGALAAAVLFGLLAARRMLCTVPRFRAPDATGRGGVRSVYLNLIVQIVAALVMPWLRSRVQGANWEGTLRRISPTHIFFRWLGLEK